MERESLARAFSPFVFGEEEGQTPLEHAIMVEQYARMNRAGRRLFEPGPLPGNLWPKQKSAQISARARKAR